MDQENSAANVPLMDWCDVCGDTATGEHFGTIACDACGNFFQESIYNDVYYYCAAKDCVIEHGMTDDNCQYCYLYKCLSAGMTCGFVPRAWVRLLNRLTCDESGSDESVSYDDPEQVNFVLAHVGSEQDNQTYQNSSFDTYDARSPDITLSVPPSVEKNSDIIVPEDPTVLPFNDAGLSGGMENITNWGPSSVSVCDGSRDSERAGVSSGMRGSRTYRDIEGVDEAVVLSNGIEAAGSSRDMERVGISNDMESNGRSTGKETVGFSSSTETAGRSKNMERVGISSDMESMGSRCVKTVVFSNDIEVAGRSKDMERFGISNVMESKGRSTGVEAARRPRNMERVEISNDMESKGSSTGIGAVMVSNRMEVAGRYRDMDAFGFSNDIEAARRTRNMERFGISNDMESKARSLGKEAMGFSNGIEAAGRPIDMEKFGISDGNKPKGRSKGMETVGFSNGIEAAGRPRDMEKFGISDGKKPKGRSRGTETVGLSNGVEAAGRSRNVKRCGNSNDIKSKRRSRDMEAVAVSNSTEAAERSRDIKSVNISNDIKVGKKSSGMEAVGFPNGIEIAGISRDLRPVEFPNDMEAGEKSSIMVGMRFHHGTEAARISRDIEEVGFSNGMDRVKRSRGVGSSNHTNAAGTSRGVQSLCSSSDMVSTVSSSNIEIEISSSGIEDTVSYSDIENAMTSMGVKRAASSRSIQIETVSRGLKKGRKSRVKKGSKGVGTSKDIKRTRISSTLELRIPTRVAGFGLFGSIENSSFRTFGDLDSLGISSIKLVEFSRYAENERISKSLDGTRDGIQDFKISLQLNYARNLVEIENYHVAGDVLTPNSLDLPLEVPTSEICSLTRHIACESSSRIIFALARWMFTLPHFVALPNAFQVTLYRNTWPQLFVLALARWAAPCGLNIVLSNMMKCVREEQRLRSIRNSGAPLPANGKPIMLVEYTDEHIDRVSFLMIRLRRFIGKMKKMQVTDSENAHMRAICLFSTERAPSILIEKFEAFQSNVLRSLRACIHNEDRVTNLQIELSIVNIFTNAFLEDVFFMGLLGNVSMEDAIPHVLDFEREFIEN